MLYLIWELQLINQLYLCKIILRVTAKYVKKFLSKNDVMEWPAQSPGMDPIENVWKLLNEKPQENNPINVEELWTNLKEEWEKISIEECKTWFPRVTKDLKLLLKVKVYTSVLMNFERYFLLDVMNPL